MTLLRYSRLVESVFSLLGDDEKALTDTLAWVLDSCPTFRRAFLKSLTARAPQGDELEVATQTHGEDAGFTDIEISGSNDLHLVIEAKRGWILPSVEQLRRYAKRLSRNGLPKQANILVSLSECSGTYAALFLPHKVRGILVRHLSWRDVLNLSLRSKRFASTVIEKSWLQQFALYLKGVATMQDVQSNKVFVVSLSKEEIRKGSGYRWSDVIERDGRYFHPVGKGWPSSPPNYIGFRYDGRLQTIHQIRSYTVCNQLQEENQLWPKSNSPHFLYKLGRPIRPPLDITLGKLYSNQRVWCLIDTLLTGEFKTLKEAAEASKKRLERASSD